MLHGHVGFFLFFFQPICWEATGCQEASAHDGPHKPGRFSFIVPTWAAEHKCLLSDLFWLSLRSSSSSHREATLFLAYIKINTQRNTLTFICKHILGFAMASNTSEQLVLLCIQCCISLNLPICASLRNPLYCNSQVHICRTWGKRKIVKNIVYLVHERDVYVVRAEFCAHLV